MSKVGLPPARRVSSGARASQPRPVGDRPAGSRPEKLARTASDRSAFDPGKGPAGPRRLDSPVAAGAISAKGLGFEVDDPAVRLPPGLTFSEQQLLDVILGKGAASPALLEDPEFLHAAFRRGAYGFLSSSATIIKEPDLALQAIGFGATPSSAGDEVASQVVAALVEPLRSDPAFLLGLVSAHGPQVLRAVLALGENPRLAAAAAAREEPAS